jgi:hypothetical protein
MVLRAMHAILINDSVMLPVYGVVIVLLLDLRAFR